MCDTVDEKSSHPPQSAAAGSRPLAERGRRGACQCGVRSPEHAKRVEQHPGSSDQPLESVAAADMQQQGGLLVVVVAQPAIMSPSSVVPLCASGVSKRAPEVSMLGDKGRGSEARRVRPEPERDSGVRRRRAAAAQSGSGSAKQRRKPDAGDCSPPIAPPQTNNNTRRQGAG